MTNDSITNKRMFWAKYLETHSISVSIKLASNKNLTAQNNENENNNRSRELASLTSCGCGKETTINFHFHLTLGYTKGACWQSEKYFFLFYIQRSIVFAHLNVIFDQCHVQVMSSSC